jgi:hypothetical protein
LYKIAEISSHGEYSYYGSVFIAFEIFPNHNAFCGTDITVGAQYATLTLSSCPGASIE